MRSQMARRRTKGRNVNGILILDKAVGLSSNAALQRAKCLFNAAKAGHTGSLDPLASGVLPICFGEATKFSQYLLDSNKTYITTATFGIKTSTGDAEGEIIANRPLNFTENDLIETLTQFVGNIEQIPPMYSALKHQGQPLYKLAREGKTVDRPPRKVCIHSLKLEENHKDKVVLQVKCSKGTYIRTLVEDIGEALNCCAHVSALKRIQVEPYQEDQSWSLEQVKEILENQGNEGLDKLLYPVDSAMMQWPVLKPGKTSCFYLQQGQPVMVPGAPVSGIVRLYNDNAFIGIGKINDDGKVAPKRMLMTA